MLVPADDRADEDDLFFLALVIIYSANSNLAKMALPEDLTDFVDLFTEGRDDADVEGCDSGGVTPTELLDQIAYHRDLQLG